MPSFCAAAPPSDSGGRAARSPHCKDLTRLLPAVFRIIILERHMYALCPILSALSFPATDRSAPKLPSKPDPRTQRPRTTRPARPHHASLCAACRGKKCWQRCPEKFRRAYIAQLESGKGNVSICCRLRRVVERHGRAHLEEPGIVTARALPPYWPFFANLHPDGDAPPTSRSHAQGTSPQGKANGRPAQRQMGPFAGIALIRPRPAPQITLVNCPRYRNRPGSFCRASTRRSAAERICRLAEKSSRSYGHERFRRMEQARAGAIAGAERVDGAGDLGGRQSSLPSLLTSTGSLSSVLNPIC